VHREYRHGDEVRARTLSESVELLINEGDEVIGTLCGMDWGVNKDGQDVIKHAQVFVKHLDAIFPVDPDTIEYITDDNGFYFTSEPQYGSVTVGRNDSLMLDKNWMHAVGARLMYQSMRGEPYRWWGQRWLDWLVTTYALVKQKLTLRGP
jgi:hypothetical protein